MNNKQIKQIALQAVFHFGYLFVCFLLFIGIFFINLPTIITFVNDFNTQIESNYQTIQEANAPIEVIDVSYGEQAAISLLFVYGLFALFMIVLYVFRGFQYKEWKKNALISVGGFILFVIFSLISLFIQVQQPILFSTTLMSFVSIVLQILLWAVYFYLFVYATWWVKKKKYSFSHSKWYLAFFTIALLPSLLFQNAVSIFISIILFVILQSYMYVVQKPFRR